MADTISAYRQLHQTPSELNARLAQNLKNDRIKTNALTAPCTEPNSCKGVNSFAQFWAKNLMTPVELKYNMYIRQFRANWSSSIFLRRSYTYVAAKYT